ncbi:hypothetical protein Fcan01_14555 [Folsomia candida]|uniref:Uncharacterized protein n=1 Tax=Folsomia candida TaxID=158441 RepID=A0A226E276_FOLCA|nr:hypothetical protein Fcan01_14555 [Folsomia candida]
MCLDLDDLIECSLCAALRQFGSSHDRYSTRSPNLPTTLSARSRSIDEQQFNFVQLNHVKSCPYRPAGGDGVLPSSRDEEEDEIDWQPEVGVKSDEDIQTIFD